HHAPFCFARMARLQPKFLHLQQQPPDAREVAPDLLAALPEILPARNDGKTRPAVLTALQPEKTAHHGMPFFVLDGILVPQEPREIVPVAGPRRTLADILLIVSDPRLRGSETK